MSSQMQGRWASSRQQRLVTDAITRPFATNGFRQVRFRPWLDRAILAVLQDAATGFGPQDDTRRREQPHEEYVEDFNPAVAMFLELHLDQTDLANWLVGAFTDHAAPVGIGTVARTELIPAEQRAEAAVIARMHHQTTGYEGW
jgi:hypothetical protein